MSEQYEKNWDNLLNIKTGGRDDSLANTYNYPYEPTPYKVLERLANSGYIRKKDLLVDYGCGKHIFKLIFLYFFGGQFLLVSRKAGNFSQT